MVKLTNIEVEFKITVSYKKACKRLWQRFDIWRINASGKPKEYPKIGIKIKIAVL